MKCFYNVTQVTLYFKRFFFKVREYLKYTTDIFLNIAICKRRSEVTWLQNVGTHPTPLLQWYILYYYYSKKKVWENNVTSAHLTDLISDDFR